MPPQSVRFGAKLSEDRASVTISVSKNNRGAVWVGVRVSGRLWPSLRLSICNKS